MSDAVKELQTAELVTHFDPILLTGVENPNAKLTLFTFCEGDVFMTSDSYALTDHLDAEQHVKLQLQGMAYLFKVIKPLSKGICNAAFMRHVRAVLEDIKGFNAGGIVGGGLTVEQEPSGMCVLKMIGQPEKLERF